MVNPGYRGAVRPKHRLRSLIVIAIVVVATVLAGNWAWNTAKDYGLVGPVQVPSQYRALVLDAAQRCPAISPEILAAQLVNESHWDPKATSPAGAQGIAQFMPDVWNQVGIDANGDGRANIWDPEDAIPSAAEFNCLNRKLVKAVSGNRLKNTLAAYNAGHGAVRKYDGIPPYPETENYVRAVIEDAKNISW
jgi:soluble lytic murein transglycosylase-like protein